MTDISYASAPLPVRTDLLEAHRQVWEKLAGPGTWWTGGERVAIAAETRTARHCALCQERKAALSPAAVQGTHDTEGNLPAPVVELIHAVTTDPGRLSKQWYEQLLEAGLQDTQYVETLGIVVRTVSVDTFCRGIGVSPHPWPKPVEGAPTRRRPPAAKMEVAWVPTIPTGEAVGPEADLYGTQYAANVIRALSLVPDEVRLCINVLVLAQYMDGEKVLDPSCDPGRAIKRPQIELLAARVSMLNQCFY